MRSCQSLGEAGGEGQHTQGGCMHDIVQLHVHEGLHACTQLHIHPVHCYPSHVHK